MTELFGGLATRIYRVVLGLVGVLALFAGVLGAMVGWSWATDVGSRIVPAAGTAIGASLVVVFLVILFLWTRWLVRSLTRELQRDVARDITIAISLSEDEQDADGRS